MDTNQANQTSDRGPRFCASNPPPDEDKARERIDRITLDMATIEADLQHPSPTRFADDAEREVWRGRAEIALHHYKKEKAFLESWLRQRTCDLPACAQDVRERARAMTKEFEKKYTPVFTTDDPPKDLATANTRYAELTGIKHQIQAMLSEITTAWASNALSRSGLANLKDPLNRIMAQIETELCALKAFRRNNTVLGSQKKWKTVCAQALSRAVSEGFVLTPDEQAVFTELKRGIPDS